MVLRPVIAPLLPLLLLLLGACDSAPKKTPTDAPPAPDRSVSDDGPGSAQRPLTRSLELVSHVGGTHYRTIVHNGRWLQTFANDLLVLDRERGTIDARRELAEFGSAGPAVDFAAMGDRGLVVLDRDAVIEVGADAGDLAIRATHDWQSLGIRPRRVSVSGGDFWIGGEGGVLRWSDRTRFLTEELSAPVGVVVQGPSGPLAVVGKRVHDLGTGNVVGSATDLLELPPGLVAPLAFAVQGKESVTIGLMGVEPGPVLGELASVTIPGTSRRLRYFDGRLWCVTDTGILSWTVPAAGGTAALADQRTIRVKGARDVDMLTSNRLAVSGSFGRAIYRREPEGQLPGDEFIGAVREASRLEKAITDGRRILAGSDAEGFWMYLIGAEAELTDRDLVTYKQPVQNVRGPWGKAEIVDGAKHVKGTMDGIPQEYVPEGRPDIYCLAAADDCLWIGHDYGIDVVGRTPEGLLTRIGSLRLHGPVRYIEPKWDRGAAYVAEYAGFGVARVKVEELVAGQIVDGNAVGGGSANTKDKPSGSSDSRNRPRRPGDGD